MKKQEFYKKLADALEITSTDLTSATILSEIDEYDSMAVMGIIAFTDENFDIKLNAKQIASITDLNSLMNLIGSGKFVD